MQPPALSRGVGEEGLKEERLNVFPCPMRGVICDYDEGMYNKKAGSISIEPA